MLILLTKLWTAIAKSYAAKSPNRVLHYWKSLQTTKKNDLSVDSYFLKMKDLATIGDPITKRDLVIYILGGLGSDYQPIFTILEVWPDQYTLDEVQHYLLFYESKLEEANSTVNFELNHKATHLVTESCANSSSSISTLGIFGHPNMVLLSGSNAHFSFPASFDNGQMVMSPTGCGIRGPFLGFSGYGHPFLSFPRFQQILGCGTGNLCRGRGRGVHGCNSGRFSKPTCQLCGLHRHTTAYCYYRFDKNYMGGAILAQSSQFVSSPQFGSQTMISPSIGSFVST